MTMKKITKILITLIAILINVSLMRAQDPNAFITVWEPTSDTLAYPGIGTDYKIVVRNLTTNSVEQTIENASSNLDATSNAVVPYVIRDLTAGNSYAIEVTPNGEPETFNGFRVLQTDEERLNLKEIKQWGTIQWSAGGRAVGGLYEAFMKCANMELTATDQPILGERNTQLSSMFNGCSTMQGNSSITGWDTSNVRHMSMMFADATKFNQPLNWDVQAVATMTLMFRRTAFNQNIGHWKLRIETLDLTNMFRYTELDCDNYGLILKGWAADPDTPTGRTLGAPGVQYSADAAEARKYLIETKGWTITDDGVCVETNVELTPDKISKFSVLRNPVLNNAYFAFSPSLNGDKIIIADLSGKIIISKLIGEGETETSISLNHLPKGVYMAIYKEAQGKQSALKLIK